ncbi:hypothetical protein [Candidatus Contendibacter odensensis]|uniref:DUF4139 domain-containing protein n=1 Tax=Candidatus Contendobacter odensis Run_B_J11 TaxID=1400861 RepID=A0A7U7G9I1_9GAMM|nr:hypothetical protein [Candidatus Contendobacter odensis]CDH44044.1 exported hypothetical protein [Candidatus Contendobacter odensis Run_B_J11]
MNRTRWLYPLTILLLCSAAPLDALARIKLTTLPMRERVEIQLDHPQVALVEEERIVPLVKGVNQVDFSWANTRIDPDSLVLRILAPPADQPLEAKVLSVSYPPNETALVWSVAASASGAVRVRISYVLGGLGKDFHYRAVADRDEKTLNLTQLLRVNNNANEAYDTAEFWAGVGERFNKPLGLNETKEVQLGRFAAVPVRKTYTSSPMEFGYLDRAQDKLNVPMHYVIKNAGGTLGQEPLPAGKARIFQDDGKGGSAFLGEDRGKFTAPDDELTLYLGLARDIAVRRTVDHNERQRIAGNLYRYDVTLKYEIENFKDAPVTLDLVESVRQIRNDVRGDSGRDPEWKLGDGTLRTPDPEKSDADTLLFHVDLPARAAAGQAQKQIHTLRLTLNNEW